MSTKILALLAMLLLSASLAGAAVCEDETDATGGYTVTPAKDANGDVGIRWIYDTITQGDTNWHSKIVSTNINTLNVDLNWGDPTDSLRLTVYAPDGHPVFGPYFDDDFGGIDDGRINLSISNPNGIAKGTWRYEVYGHSVLGTEDYYI
ncbi:MAG: peptidase domain-containing protein [Euryarchaeota archaeon]|nr:peptidase domain-containing protein [Euryarchaeota archaeon]